MSARDSAAFHTDGGPRCRRSSSPAIVGDMNEDRGAPSEQLSLTRKQLYDMVWSTPMLRLSRTFQCSSTWLARICRDASVPVPPRGYWAKKRAGKAARRQALPRSASPDEIVVSYMPPSESSEPAPAPPPPPPPALDEDLEELRSQIEQAGPIEITPEFDQLHPVIARTRKALRATDPKYQHRHGLLQPRWANDGCILELDVSATAIDRAVHLFEALFRALQQFGGKVVAAEKAPHVKLLGERLRYYLRERPRMRKLAPEEIENRWDSKFRWEGSGVFDLSVSTDDEVGFSHRWRDGRKGPLETRIQWILLDTVEAIQDGRTWRRGAPAREAERQRKLEDARRLEVERFRQEEERRHERERVAYLFELAAQHTKAVQLREFLAACRAAPDPSPAGNRLIAWGERVLAGVDPLGRGLAPILAARPSYGPPLFAIFREEPAGDGSHPPPDKT